MASTDLHDDCQLSVTDDIFCSSYQRTTLRMIDIFASLYT